MPELRWHGAATALCLLGLSSPAAGPGGPERRANDREAEGQRGAVVSAEPHASRAGLEVLRRGGNAMDAAVATFLTLAVTHPQAGNLGGGGFLLYRPAKGPAVAIDFRERAPASAHRDMYLREDGTVDAEKSLFGATAAAVPGSPAGIVWALEHYGTKSLDELAAPAIRLARQGVEVDHFLANALAAKQAVLGRFPSTRDVFFVDDERPLRAGERLVQTDLAGTLARFATGGVEQFYGGATGERILAQLRAGGVAATPADLTSYRPVERAPLRGLYRGYEILSMPPPSSGGVALLQMLNILEDYDLAALGFGSSQTLHLTAEAMRRAYADRSRWLGDPDHWSVPVEGMISKDYAAKLRATIRADRATDVAPGRPPGAEEGEDTTHFSVVDAAGNAVSCTTTINSTFGSGLVVRGAGFFLNNEMDDFSAKPGTPNQFGLVGGEANAVAAGKRPLSSMTPTIIVREGRVRWVLGSPGGGRIINTVLQVALNLIDHGMSLRHAVDAPRVHHQWKPNHLFYEPWVLSADVREALGALGHRFAPKPSKIGRCQAIAVHEDGTRVGVADARSGGTAVAY